MFIGEETGELSKVNLVTGKTDTIRKIDSCSNLTCININPMRFVLIKMLNFFVVVNLIRIDISNRKNIAFGTTHGGEIYISNYG